MEGEKVPRFAELEEGMEVAQLPGFKAVKRKDEEPDLGLLGDLLAEHDRVTRLEGPAEEV